MKDRQDILATVLRKHEDEVRKMLSPIPDWERATRTFDALFARMANPKDSLWSKSTIEKLTSAFDARRGDYGSGITLRTAAAMPRALRNATKEIFLQIAEACSVFNASHKVNFEIDELPDALAEGVMIPAKRKGFVPYAEPLPSLYAKTSLSFDYWVPKIFGLGCGDSGQETHSLARGRHL